MGTWINDCKYADRLFRLSGWNIKRMVCGNIIKSIFFIYILIFNLLFAVIMIDLIEIILKIVLVILNIVRRKFYGLFCMIINRFSFIINFIMMFNILFKLIQIGFYCFNNHTILVMLFILIQFFIYIFQ